MGCGSSTAAGEALPPKAESEVKLQTQPKHHQPKAVEETAQNGSQKAAPRPGDTASQTPPG
eukprot:CAMPEP_0169431974 /NCGR_PEP_ID=MMETSP1042-20121227/3232_1 /TAXON_ID=464988 /ORGANISM="Hemiselmis andersenii, Strain CCMP1180" /LENGTH=60 /DNA_ID=CAMNT_0009542419 /DNA_START=388 /DNA_END=567 /DNA_ORIENTATION=+